MWRNNENPKLLSLIDNTKSLNQDEISKEFEYKDETQRNAMQEQGESNIKVEA